MSGPATPSPEPGPKSRSRSRLLYPLGLIVIAIAALALFERFRHSEPAPPPPHEPAEALIAPPQPQSPAGPEAPPAPPPPPVVINEPNAPDAAPRTAAPLARQAPEERNAYLVQAGVFTSAANARALQQRLADAGVHARVETRVHLGPYKNRRDAEQALAKLKKLGVNAVMVPAR